MIRARARAGEAGAVDLSRIRHPQERAVFVLSVLANAAVIAIAAGVVYASPEWLSSHPRLASLVQRVRLAAIAAILLLPVLGFLRLGHWAQLRQHAVRVGHDQVPDIHAILESQCRALGVELPELYLSAADNVGISTAIAFHRGRRRLIVLGKDLFAGLEQIRDRADVLGWVLAHELGRIALGHAGLAEELVLGYLKRIPVLRAPLLAVQCASRDRFAATLSPASVRALVYLAVGGDLLPHVDGAAFVREALRDDTPWIWAWIGRRRRDDPPVLHRIRGLHRAGLLAAAPGLG